MSNPECNGNCVVCYVTGYMSLTKAVFCVVFILLIMVSSEESTIIIYKSNVTVDPVVLTMLLVLSVAEMFLAPLLISGLNTDQAHLLFPWLILYSAYEAIAIFLMCNGWKEDTDISWTSADEEKSYAKTRFQMTLGAILTIQLYLMVSVSARAVAMMRRSSRRDVHRHCSQPVVVRRPTDLPPAYEECLTVVDEPSDWTRSVVRTLHVVGRRRSHGLVPETPPPSYTDCSFPFKGSP